MGKNGSDGSEGSEGSEAKESEKAIVMPLFIEPQTCSQEVLKEEQCLHRPSHPLNIFSF